MRRIGDATYEKVFSVAKGEITEDELTTEEKHILERWRTCFSIMMNYNTIQDTVPMMMVKFPKLSQSQAYRDCAFAQKLFGNIFASNKEGLRHMLTEWAKEVIQLARAKNPPDLKEINNALRNIAVINGLDKEDPDKIDFSKLEKHNNPINVPPELLELLLKLANKGAVNLSDVRQGADNAQDGGYATIIDE